MAPNDYPTPSGAPCNILLPSLCPFLCIVSGFANMRSSVFCILVCGELNCFTEHDLLLMFG